MIFFKQQGVEEGRQTEKFDIAKNMLQRNTDVDFVREVTGLPMESIRGFQIA